MKKIEGVLTALITPFRESSVDEAGLRTLVEEQVAAGVHGLLVLGTTGEASTLSDDERRLVIEVAKDALAGRCLLMVGTGCNNTAKTLARTQEAKDLGADCALVVNPYYNCPTQEGLKQHFLAIAEAVDLPLFLYNHPGRCGVNLTAESILALSEHERIVGVKEASGSLQSVMHVLQKKRLSAFSVMSGDDLLSLPMMSMGAQGVISVVSHLCPRDMLTLVEAARDGAHHRAQDLFYKLLPLMEASMMENNPIAIKAALNLCGKPAGSCRLPLTAATADTLEKLQHTLQAYNLTPDSSTSEVAHVSA